MGTAIDGLHQIRRYRGWSYALRIITYVLTGAAVAPINFNVRLLLCVLSCVSYGFGRKAWDLSEKMEKAESVADADAESTRPK